MLLECVSYYASQLGPGVVRCWYGCHCHQDCDSEGRKVPGRRHDIVSKHASVYDMASFTVHVFGTCVSHFLMVYFGYIVVNKKIGLIDFLNMNIYIGDLNNDFKIFMIACIPVGFSTGLSLAMLPAVVSGDHECKEVKMVTHQPDRGAEQTDGNVERVHEILDLVAEPAAASYLANVNEDTGLALSEEQWR